MSEKKAPETAAAAGKEKTTARGGKAPAKGRQNAAAPKKPRTAPRKTAAKTPGAAGKTETAATAVPPPILQNLPDVIPDRAVNPSVMEKILGRKPSDEFLAAANAGQFNNTQQPLDDRVRMPPKGKSKATGKKEGKGKVGRPADISWPLIERIVKYIMDANYIETACAICGVSKQTFYNWCKKAKEEGADPIYQEFLDAVEKAEAWAQANDLHVIGQAGNKSWQARAWRLERRFPKQFGRTVHVDGGMGFADVSKAISEEEAQRIAGELANVFGAKSYDEMIKE